MNGIVKISIGGQERILRFNNFATLEMAKVIFNSSTAKPDGDFLERLLELNKKNHFLLIKVLVYSGIIGNDYVVGFSESVTIEEVGEWVSMMNDSELTKIWEVFWESTGVTLAPEKTDTEKEEQDTDSKKKVKPITKRSYPGPSGK